MAIINKTLANNIVLISQNVPDTKVCSIGFWYNAGSRYERDDERGISHFAEHMLFKGTGTRTARDIACLFDRLGGYVNAFTEKEDVCLYATFPNIAEKTLSLVVDCLSDMGENCTFPEDEFERERDIILSEIASVRDDPEECALDEVSKCIWIDENLCASITGSEKDVASITIQDIKSWYGKYFKEGELTVIAVGNFDERELEGHIAKLNVHKKVLKYPGEKHFEKGDFFRCGKHFVKSGFNQTQIFALYPLALPLTEKENYVASVFNSILGDSMSSRLFETLREKNGLCYSVYSFFTFYENAGVWASYASCEKKNSSETCGLLQKVISLFLSGGITDDELEGAKEHLCGEETIGECDMEFVMKRIQRNYSMGFSLLETQEILECIRDVTKNDIMEFAGKILDESKKALVIYGKKRC